MQLLSVTLQMCVPAVITLRDGHQKFLQVRIFSRLCLVTRWFQWPSLNPSDSCYCFSAGTTFLWFFYVVCLLRGTVQKLLCAHFYGEIFLRQLCQQLSMASIWPQPSSFIHFKNLFLAVAVNITFYYTPVQSFDGTGKSDSQWHKRAALLFFLFLFFVTIAIHLSFLFVLVL